MQQAILRREFRAMGCQMVIGLDSPANLANHLLEQVPNWFEDWEQSLSRFRDDSELNRLNRQPDQAIPVSETLWEVLKSAQWAYEYSQGLVSPAVLDAMLSIGYDRTFETISAGSRAYQAAPASQETASLEDIRLEPDQRAVTLPAGLRLDFGGVAKGWAAQQAAQRLSAYGPALVDAGGDIAISSRLRSGEPWVIGIDDPFAQGENYDYLLLGRCGVATSGTDFRRWQQDGVWQHHIIDPRRGAPAKTDICSVTIVAPDVLQAEAAAKTILISGSREGMAWLESHPELAGILVLENGVRLYSQKIKPYLWSKQ